MSNAAAPEAAAGQWKEIMAKEEKKEEKNTNYVTCLRITNIKWQSEREREKWRREIFGERGREEEQRTNGDYATHIKVS